MAKIDKQMSEKDANQVLMSAYSDTDATIAVSGFVSSKVGARITRSVISPTVDDYSFYDTAKLLYRLRVTYNNSDHDEIDQVERTV